VLLFIVKSLKQSAVTAIKWNAIGQFGNNFLNFTFSIILARLLSPADFGLVTLVFVVTEVSNVFIESGFASGLIQSKNVTEIDFSTIYVFNILVGLLFSFLIYFSGGFFAAFYEDTRLVNITKAISVIYIINSFSIVPKAYLTRKMDFKPQTFIGLVTSSVTGALGISLAFAGFGYWALVLKRLCESILNTLGYIFVSKWKISFRFSLMSLKKYWRYSSNILFTSLIGSLTENADYVFVGKLYSSAQLGLYSRGKTYAFIPVDFLSSVINRTIFPLFSKMQDDPSEFERNYVKTCQLVIYLFLPIMFLTIIDSKEIITILLGKKWLGASEYLGLFSIVGFLYILNSFRFHILNSSGLSNYNFQIGLLLSPLRLCCLFLASCCIQDISPKIFLYIILGVSVMGLFVRSYYMERGGIISARKNNLIGIKEFSLNVGIGSLLLFFKKDIGMGPIGNLLVLPLIYFFVYISMSKIGSLESYNDFVSILRERYIVKKILSFAGMG